MMNFQLWTITNSFIRIFFQSIVKDELAALQRGTAIRSTAEPGIAYSFLYRRTLF